MSPVILVITLLLPVIPIMAVILRSGAFGRGSIGTLLKLFFLGALAAVPAFLMEAGGMLVITVIMNLVREESGRILLSSVLRYLLLAALIEEAWKFFIVRVSTWEKMIMENLADGVAASAVVGVGFSVILYLLWQASYILVPADMETLRASMPVFLGVGAVSSFLYALLYVPAHFGFSGLMGVLYGAAKRSAQKGHGFRAGFMTVLSFLAAFLLHGACAAFMSYGFESGKILWLAAGFVLQFLLAVLIGSGMGAARRDMLENAAGYDRPEEPVDFADSDDFAEYAESAGEADNVYAVPEPAESTPYRPAGPGLFYDMSDMSDVTDLPAQKPADSMEVKDGGYDYDGYDMDAAGMDTAYGFTEAAQLPADSEALFYEEREDGNRCGL